MYYLQNEKFLSTSIYGRNLLATGETKVNWIQLPYLKNFGREGGWNLGLLTRMFTNIRHGEIRNPGRLGGAADSGIPHLEGKGTF